MRYINLGSSDMKVSSTGLGCMGMTHAYGAPSDEAEIIKLIHSAAYMGITFFDTAECYTGYDKNGQLVYNEELVGKALKPYRDKVVIATKFGVHHNSDLSLKTDSRPETIRKSIEGSLARLGTDYIDLYYQHRVDPDVPVEEVAGTVQDLIREGKVRCWGMSEVTEDTIRRADKVWHLTAVQNRYSMMCRHYENLIPILKEMGIAFVAHSPMANGYLIYILPGLVSPWYVFMMRTFFKEIPGSIIESVIIDGGNEFTIFAKFILPLSKPVLATVCVFLFFGKWQDWMTAMLYIDNDKLISLQYLLQRIMKNIELLQNMETDNLQLLSEVPSETVRMAMAVLVAGPILLVFLFFQKYFVKGMTVGAVKG